MKAQKNTPNQQVPDALGNDKLQGDDMPKAGQPEQTDIFVGDDELKKEPEPGNEELEERDTDTIGIP